MIITKKQFISNTMLIEHDKVIKGVASIFNKFRLKPKADVIVT